MESQNIINDKIVSMTKNIIDNYPELIKYMDEIPMHFLSKPKDGITTQDLQEYLDSLETLVDNYSKEH